MLVYVGKAISSVVNWEYVISYTTFVLKNEFYSWRLFFCMIIYTSISELNVINWLVIFEVYWILWIPWHCRCSRCYQSAGSSLALNHSQWPGTWRLWSAQSGLQGLALRDQLCWKERKNSSFYFDINISRNYIKVLLSLTYYTSEYKGQINMYTVFIDQSESIFIGLPPCLLNH